MDSKTQFFDSIRSKGLRMTRQRKLILDVLTKTKDHLDAETLYTLVRNHDPRIGLATIYRTLALLKDFGLVTEHDLGEPHAHFEAALDDPHYHFTCNSCRQVIEFESPILSRVITSLEKEKSVQVEAVNLSLCGFCKDCTPATNIQKR